MTGACCQVAEQTAPFMVTNNFSPEFHCFSGHFTERAERWDLKRVIFGNYYKQDFNELWSLPKRWNHNGSFSRRTSSNYRIQNLRAMFLSSSGIRWSYFISVYNFSAHWCACFGNHRSLKFRDMAMHDILLGSLLWKNTENIHLPSDFTEFEPF